ncbi:MAG: hypothetical protein ABS76_27060 [Pelagibacterium sp. SCN 64-44]|nr:MAG: hypothetical protein ABS76_27060 [Pelagibacterium sp. SCN 64-44]
MGALRRPISMGSAEQVLSQAWRHILAGAVALQALCLAVPALAGGADGERLLPGVYPEAPVPLGDAGLREPYDPFFDVDWSVALRGSYSRASSGERFDTRLAPKISLEHVGTRAAVRLDADAEVTRPNGDGQISVTGLRLGLEAGYDLDRDTRLVGSGDFTVSQGVAGTPGIASNVVSPARSVSGGGELGVTRRFGKLNIGLTGGLTRTVYGPTTLDSGALVDNWRQNYTAYDAGLRVGYQITPILEVFAEAGLGRDVFDNAPMAGPRLDATNTSLRGGVTGRWNSGLEATVSTGLGLRRFDAAGLEEVTSQLYDAQIRYAPDSTWRLGAGFATTLAPTGPDGAGAARIAHAANASVDYKINSWLALRAGLDWNTARFAGSPDTETGHGWRVGADYTLDARTAVTADYDYAYAESSRNGVQDAHRVTMGVTVSR